MFLGVKLDADSESEIKMGVSGVSWSKKLKKKKRLENWAQMVVPRRSGLKKPIKTDKITVTVTFNKLLISQNSLKLKTVFVLELI